MFHKRNPKVGATPGTLVIPKQAPEPRMHVIRYNAESIVEQDVDTIEELQEAMQDGAISWVDVQGFGDRTLMKQIGELFDFHPLLLEDLVNVPQRPKADAYDDQLLLIVKMVRVDDGDEIDMEQVSIVLGPSYVLTVQERYGDILDPVRRRIRNPSGVVRRKGCDYLFYALADTIIDGYYPVLETIGDYLETLDEAVVHDPTPELLQQLNQVKNRLVNLRRAIWPQREAFNSLVRGDHAHVTDAVRIYLRDTYDHTVQTSEVAEMYREMVTGLMSVYLSAIANRTNEVMKVLTVMASIFIPITFIAGVYGMNFQDMPELHYRWAYPAVWIAMLTTAAGMLAYFWRKGWLGDG